ARLVRRRRRHPRPARHDAQAARGRRARRRQRADARQVGGRATGGLWFSRAPGGWSPPVIFPHSPVGLRCWQREVPTWVTIIITVTTAAAGITTTITTATTGTGIRTATAAGTGTAMATAMRTIAATRPTRIP